MADHPWIHGDHTSGQRMPGGLSRWSGTKGLEWEPLRPELVVEVGYDAMEGDRFRHTAQFVRWRPDREPRSCGYDQLDRPIRFDVDQVLARRSGGHRLTRADAGPASSGHRRRSGPTA